MSPGIWQVEADLSQKLRALGNRNDIIKTMHRKLRDWGETAGAVIFDKDQPQAQPITGQVVHKGLADELRESKYLLLAAEDGKTYYIALSKFSEPAGLESSPGAIVTVSVTAMSPVTPGRGREAGNRVSITVESYLSFQDQIKALGPTWLDQQLARGVSITPDANRLRSSFEKEKVDALQARFNRLQQMGMVDANNTRLKASFIDDLYRNELHDVQQKLSSVYGQAVTLQPGQPFTGTLEQIARLSSGPHAVIRAGGEFTVIPWQRGLERVAPGQALRVERDKQSTVPDPTRPTLQQQRIRFVTLEGVQKTLVLGTSL